MFVRCWKIIPLVNDPLNVIIPDTKLYEPENAPRSLISAKNSSSELKVTPKSPFPKPARRFAGIIKYIEWLIWKGIASLF